MPTVTGGQVILDAFGDLNVSMPSDTLATLEAATPGLTADALRRLNLMVGQWANESLTIPAAVRYVFPLQNNKGGPADPGTGMTPYTIGIGGDLNVPRPTFQNSVVAAGLLLGLSNPPVEIPRGLMTNDAWNLTRIKDLTSALFTNVYYRPDYLGDLGSIFLWPVPFDLTNFLVLYVEQPLSSFADTTTIYSIPPGFDDALHYNLARRLSTPYGRQYTAQIRGVDADVYTFANVQRVNVKLFDLSNDLIAIGRRAPRSGYNIQTGEY